MGIPSDDELQAKMTRKMAVLLASSPDTMAWVLDRYKEVEQVDDATIQHLLGVSENAYYHLAICGRPRSDLFSLDIEIIATHIGMKQEPLIRLVRHVETLDTFRNYQDVAAAGLLAAARDHAAEEPSEYNVEPSTDESTPPAEPDDEQ
jgi:hypothetical protein